MIYDLIEMFQGWKVIPKFKNLDELKSKGELTEENETVGDTIKKKIHFKSFDGKTEIYREVTTNKNAEKLDELSNLRRQKEQAVLEEDYAGAAKLRDQIKQLEGTI